MDGRSRSAHKTGLPSCLDHPAGARLRVAGGGVAHRAGLEAVAAPAAIDELPLPGREEVPRAGRRARRRCSARSNVVTEHAESGAVGELPPEPGRLRAWVSAHPADIVDLFVYVVVLNLAVQYLPRVISETFTLSLLTAALLKVALEVVLLLKGAVLVGLRGATTRQAKTAFALALWAVAAGSKLIVLWLIDIVFGGSVSLGGFVPVTLLVLVLLMSRAAVRRLLYGASAS